MGDTIAEIRRKIWLADRPRTLPVVTMLSLQERRLLHYLARRHFTNRGAIVDAGCFLGGSTVALAEGLRQWAAGAYAAPSHPIQTYDLFAVEAWTIGTLLPHHMRAGDSFRALFNRNLAGYRDLIEVHQGDITTMAWPGWPVEILFVDCAKVPIVNDFIVRTFFPRFIPGVSIVIQQDYIFDSWNAWIHLTMERLSDYFEILTDTGFGSVVYLNTREIPPAEIAAATVYRMAAEEKIRLLDRARRRFAGVQAIMLQRSHASYLCGPVWCTGCDAAGHLAAFARIADAELERLRPIADANLAADIDELGRALAEPGRDLAALQADVNRFIAKIGPVAAARRRDFAERSLRLIGLPQPTTRWRLGARRLWTVLRILKSYFDRALLAGERGAVRQ
jgi:hypothetical protein